MNESKNILVLPGTKWQVELVKKIKELGHKVFVVNPASDSPCFEYADAFLQSDIFDKQRVIQFGKSHKINAILSDECDIAMNLIAELGEEFNVPTLDKETAALYTDKFLMREFSKRNHLNYPKYVFCKNVEDAVAFLNKIGTNVIIKPIDSNASHGVFKCENELQVREHFEDSRSFSRNSDGVLIEQYISGPEFTVDGIKTPFGHYTLAISEKKHFKHNESIANELLFTHDNINYDYEQLKIVNDSFVNKSNLRFGFTHAEYKFENGRYYLIEIAARGGGNMISSCITQFMSGHDTYKYLVNCSTGIIDDIDFSIPNSHKNKAAVLKFFETPKRGGKVSAVKGIEFLEDHPDIKFYQFNFKKGDEIKEALNDSARIGFYIACSENLLSLKSLMKEIEAKIKIILK